MLRLLATLAATAPNFLSVFMLETCGYFGYEALHQPTQKALLVWETAGYATIFLPVGLALLALWAPRLFPPVGALAATAALLLNALTLTVPYTGPCAPATSDWLAMACQAVAAVALLLTRPEPAVPRLRATAWTGVLLLAVGQTLARNTPYEGMDYCSADLKGGWLLGLYYLDLAHSLYYWVSAAAIGAVFAAHRAAPFAGVVLLVPALFEPVAWFLSGAGHNCSSTLELFVWPYLIAGALALLSRVRLPQRA